MRRIRTQWRELAVALRPSMELFAMRQAARIQEHDTIQHQANGSNSVHALYADALLMPIRRKTKNG